MEIIGNMLYRSTVLLPDLGKEVRYLTGHDPFPSIGVNLLRRNFKPRINRHNHYNPRNLDKTNHTLNSLFNLIFTS